MFHVRNLITQTNLSILKYSINKNNIIKQVALNSSISNSENSVKLSESCVKRLRKLSDSNKHLRITVDSGGCSGFEYKFSLDTQILPEDNVIEKYGCKVIIDKDTLGFVKGSTIDYFEELIRSGFRVIDNPNSEHGCSCGTSFSIKI